MKHSNKLARIHSLSEQLRLNNSVINEAIRHNNALRTEIRRLAGLGKHGKCCIYSVKTTRVKAHTRRGYTAVRVGR